MPQKRMIVAALAVVALTGCSGPGTAAPVDGGGASQSFCDSLFAKPAAPAGPSLIIVDDQTDSTNGRGFPSGVQDAVRATAEAAGTVSVLAVDGPGANPRWVLDNASLNDASLAADTARHRTNVAKSVACVAQAAAAAVPTKEGTDLLTAFRVAADHQTTGSKTIVALTDGLANAGALNVDGEVLSTDPATLVADVTKAGELPAFKGASMALYGLADVKGHVVSQPVKAWLADLYTRICHDGGATGCRVETADQGAPAAEPADGAPARPKDKPVELPETIVTAHEGSTVFTVSSALLFEPNSAQLRADADLGAVAACMAKAGATAVITGHAAATGHPDEELQLSRDRATAVQQRVQQIAPGIDPARIAVNGVGSTQPAVQGTDDAALSRNRRVVITVTGVCG